MIVTVPDVRLVERQTHRVEPILTVRAPDAAPTLDAINLADNPSLEGGSLLGWNPNSTAAYPVTLDDTSAIGGKYSAVCTRTATTLNNAVASLYAAPRSNTRGFPVTPGTPVTASVDVKCEQPAREIRMYWQWVDANGTVIRSEANAVVVANTGAAGVINRASVTSTPPATSVTARLIVNVTTVGAVPAVVGERVWHDRLAVRTDGATDYFDGDTPAANGFTYRWSGTARASTPQRWRDVEWTPLQVVSASVEFGEVGTLPLRTFNAVVLPDTADGDNVVAAGSLTVLGSWVRIGQRVVRLNGSSFVVEHGVYRVDKITIDQLTGAVTLSGPDMGAMVADDGLMTLNEGRVATTEAYVTAIRRMLDLTVRFLTSPWWSATLDAGNANATARPKTTALQYTDSRADAVQAIAGFVGRLVITSSAWTGPLYRLVTRPTVDDPVDLDVKAGTYGNLLADGYDETSDRGEIFNTALVIYTTRTAIGGGKFRIQEKRVVATLNDADSPVRFNGPFGRVTRVAEANEIDTDAAAQAAAQTVIMDSLKMAREFTIATTPAYGIEPGDVVMVTDANGGKTRGIVVGGTIPIHAEGGTWSLTLRAFKPVDASWVPRYYTFLDEPAKIEDAADWRTYAPTRAKVDLEQGFTNGWTNPGNATVVKRGPSSLLLAATGTGPVAAATVQAWADTGLHRFKASASVRAVNHPARIRVGIDYTPGSVAWGPWVQFNAKQTRKIAADVLIPDASVTFAVRIEFRASGGGNPIGGHQFQVNSISVEQAYVP